MGAISSLDSSESVETVLKEYRTQFIPNLIHKVTKRPYVLHKFSCGSQMQNDFIEQNIQQYRENKCESISKFHEYFTSEDRAYCSQKKHYFMIFHGHQKNTIRQEYEIRCAMGQSFSSQDIELILESMVCGLREYHLRFGRGYQNFSLEDVIIEEGSNRLFLRDPWLSNSGVENSGKMISLMKQSAKSQASYCSPEKLSALYVNRFELYDELQADLFATGIYGLQLYHMEPMDQLYNKNHTVNLSAVNNYISKIPEARLRKGIELLLHPTASIRNNIYQEWNVRCPILRKFDKDRLERKPSTTVKMVPTTRSIRDSVIRKSAVQLNSHENAKSLVMMPNPSSVLLPSQNGFLRKQSQIFNHPDNYRNISHRSVERPLIGQLSRNILQSQPTKSMSQHKANDQRFDIVPIPKVQAFAPISSRNNQNRPVSISFQNNSQTQRNQFQTAPSVSPFKSSINPISFTTPAIAGRLEESRKLEYPPSTSRTNRVISMYNPNQQQALLKSQETRLMFEHPHKQQTSQSTILTRFTDSKPLDNSAITDRKEYYPVKRSAFVSQSHIIGRNSRFRDKSKNFADVSLRLDEKVELKIDGGSPFQIKDLSPSRNVTSPREFLFSPSLSSQIVGIRSDNSTSNLQLVTNQSLPNADINLNDIKQTLSHIFSPSITPSAILNPRTVELQMGISGQSQIIDQEDKLQSVTERGQSASHSKFYAEEQNETIRPANERDSNVQNLQTSRKSVQRNEDNIKIVNKLHSPYKKEEGILLPSNIQEDAKTHGIKMNEEIEKLQKELSFINSKTEKLGDPKTIERISEQEPEQFKIPEFIYSITKVTDKPLNISAEIEEAEQSTKNNQGSSSLQSGPSLSKSPEAVNPQNESNMSDSLENERDKYNATIVEVNDESTPEASENSDNESGDNEEYVVQQYQTGSRYEGHKSNGMRNGHGKFFYQDGGHYEGEWKDNKMHGWGKLFYEGGRLAYEGNWKEDEFHGFGKVYNDNPIPLETAFDYTNFDLLDDYWVYYEGSLVSDTKEGRGKIKLTNGESFEGDFHTDRIQGFGKFRTMDARTIEGIWRESRLFKVITS